MSLACPGASLRPSQSRQTDPDWTAFADPNTISLQPKGDGWQLEVKAVGIQSASLEFSLFVWRLQDPESVTLAKNLDAAVNELVNHEQIYGVTEFLYWSPFWVETLQSEQLRGYDPNSDDDRLIRYRLVEICLRAIEKKYPSPGPLAESHTLLLRQRYRLLASLDQSMDQRKRLSYDRLVREARAAYGQLLLDTLELAEQALALAALDDKQWSFDHEIEMLLLNQDEELWSFAYATEGDRRFSHWLVQNGLLKRDNLPRATKTVAAFAAEPQTVGRGFADNDATNSWRKKIANSFQYFHLWIICATLLGAVGVWLAGSGFSFLFPGSFPGEEGIVNAGKLFLSVAFIGGVIFPFLYWLLVWKLLNFRRSGLFPLAMRLPGMALVGILAIAGLSDLYSQFGVNAWTRPLAAWSVFLLSALGALLYLLFEALARVENFRWAWRRSVPLWAYGWSATFWLALLSAWLAAPIGLLACPDISSHLCLTSGPYHGQVEIVRSFTWAGQRVSMDLVFFLSALALLVGVLTQLFWADKAVTEPL